jgi:hypothetical protein
MSWVLAGAAKAEAETVAAASRDRTSWVRMMFFPFGRSELVNSPELHGLANEASVAMPAPRSSAARPKRENAGSNCRNRGLDARACVAYAWAVFVLE